MDTMRPIVKLTRCATCVLANGHPTHDDMFRLSCVNCSEPNSAKGDLRGRVVKVIDVLHALEFRAHFE